MATTRSRAKKPVPSKKNIFKPKHIIATVALLIVAGFGLIIALPMLVHAVSSTVYDATPAATLPDIEGVNLQAMSTSQFGDYVHLSGTNRILSSVTTTLSNEAVYSAYASDVRYSANNTSWTHPITINIYSNHLDGNGIADTLLATKTQDITVPWRPETVIDCGANGWKAANGQCFKGIAFNATFNWTDKVTLPNDVIVTVAYNTAGFGKAPLGVDGPYNQLKVGTPKSQVAAVGTDDNTDHIFWDTVYPGYMGGLSEDATWSPTGTVALKIVASDVFEVPGTVDQCKNSGWKKYGSKFKNQGDCVSYCNARDRDNNKNDDNRDDRNNRR
jgi:hypothetical protein